MNMSQTLNPNYEGYSSGIFDGRYVYFVPESNSIDVHGDIIRYDSGGSNSSYALSLTGADQSGGFAGGPFGITAKFANTTTVFSLSANAFNNSNSINRINDTSWHHVAVTYDGTNITLYLDGVNISSKGAPASLLASSADLIIGAATSSGTNNTTSSWFNGTIDEVAVWNRSLTANEIANHYNTQTPVIMGNHTFVAYANDTLGNAARMTAGSSSVNWFNMAAGAAEQANAAPSVGIMNQSNISISSSTPIIYINVNDTQQNTTYGEIFANGTNKSYALVQNNTATSMSWSSTSDGIYSYFARAYDNTTNGVSDSNVTLVVDTTKPTITNSSSMPFNTTTTSTWTANFTVTDNLYLENTTININGTNYTPTKQGSSYTVSGGNLTNGNNYTVTVYANDSARNTETHANGWILINITSTPPQEISQRQIGTGAPLIYDSGPEEDLYITLTVPDNIKTIVNNPIDLAINVTNRNNRPLFDLRVNMTGLNPEWYNVDVPLLRYIGPRESRIVFVEMTPKVKGTYPLLVYVQGRKIYKNATLPLFVFEKGGPGILTEPTIIPIQATIRPTIKRYFPWLLLIAVVSMAILTVAVPRATWEELLRMKKKQQKKFMEKKWK